MKSIKSLNLWSFLLSAFIVLTIFLVVSLPFIKKQNQQNSYKLFYSQTTESISNTEVEKSTSETDLNQMLNKLNSGSFLINKFWREVFRQRGWSYRSPEVYFYQERLLTPCGETIPGNAFYCLRNNTIYFHAEFFLDLMNQTGKKLGTDGDMAIIMVLAHEWGHAVQNQTGSFRGISTVDELNADCLAGAFVKFANDNKYLEKGDLEEAKFAISIAGDDPKYTGEDSHGSSKQRVNSFMKGYRLGIAKCGCI